MLLRRDAPDEQIITHPPLVCIEILSPEDRFGRIEERIADYLNLGVREVWVIDPVVVQGYRCKGANPRDWQQTNQLTVEGTPIKVDLAEIVADLD
jgi:Uma2 family endonuclease